MSLLQNNLSKYSILLTGLISLCLIYFFIWRTNSIGYKTVIDGDGKDYYSYLMSVFIDHNLGHQETTPWYVIQTPTGTINVHMIGVSLMLLPFFLIGYLWAATGGYEINGISEPFQKMISFGALFYALAGLYFLRKILLKQNYSEKTIAVTLLLIFFGTNLLNYSINEPAMSHVYSFALIAAFMYYSYNLFHASGMKYFILTGIVSALIVLVRPINIVIVLIIPLWFSTGKEFIEGVKFIYVNHKSKAMLGKLVFFAVLFLQSLVWYFQNGKLIQWSYKDNGMYLFSPNTFKMLFGFNSGFFIYTPLCLLLMLGLIPMYKDHRYQFIVLSLFTLFVFYLLSCHWAYTYFDGLSIRPMVDYMAVFAIVGAKLITSVKGKLKVMTLPALSICLLLNLITCYQYKAGILPPASMNFQKYKYIFLKTDKKYIGVLGGCNDLQPYSKKHPEKSFSYQNYIKGNNFNFVNQEFGIGYEVPELGFKTSKIYVRASLKRKESAINSSSGAVIVFSVIAPDGKEKSGQLYKLNDTPSEKCCKWRAYEYNVTMDGKMEATDKLRVFIWNKNKQSFLLSDFKVEVYNYNYKE